jgi:formylglycine-generating enzyme required for sulfatase activity
MVSIELESQRPATRRPLIRPGRLDGLRKGALALSLASGVSLLAIAVLSQLGAWESDRVEPATSNTPLAIASSTDEAGEEILALSRPDGGLVVLRGDQQVALVRGHGAAIVSASFIDQGRSLITLDAAGQTRITRLDAAQGSSALDAIPAIRALDQGLWRPYGAPVAQAVQAWTPSGTAFPAAMAAFLVALGLVAAPKVAAFAGQLQRRPAPTPVPQPVAPSRFKPLRTPGARWREPMRGLPPEAAPDMMTIPPGRFLMGSAEGERPQHEVSIGYALAMGATPVTFRQWDAAIAAGAKLNEPKDQGWGRGDRPVINVSWEDCQAYLIWLNDRLGLSGQPDAYRLPSEAEWEYACRAGTTTRWSFGDEEAQLGDHAWFNRNSSSRTQPVGGKLANPWGLFDMHGNVWEWCEDLYQSNYRGAPSDGSARIGNESSDRVIRGGSWYGTPQSLRSANRSRGTPADRDINVGFRLSRSAPGN